MQWFASARALALTALLVLLLPAILQAVQITDTLLDSTHAPANGTLLISWPSFTGSNSQVQSGGTTRIKITSGALNIFLAATVGGTSFGGGSPYYTAQFFSTTGNGSFTATWNVPVATVPVNLAAICVSGCNTSSSSGSTAGVTAIAVNGGSLQTGNVALTIPTADSQLTNDAGFQTASQVATAITSAVSSSLVNVGFSDAEVPGGTVNGSNTVFTLSQAPYPVLSLQLVRNGQTLTLGGDFTLGGSTVTFINGVVPVVGDNLQAWYRYSSLGATPSVHFSDAEVPAGVVNGSNTAFTLANTPVNPAGIYLTRNGLAQKYGLDFSISGAAITFLSVAIPTTGDVLLAWYRY
jgi:hypothetical protein